MTDPADFSWLRVLFGFAVVLSLLAAFGFIMKYLAARGWAFPTQGAKIRRMKIVESLTIDPKRRVVILDCDGREHLLLLSASHDIVIESNLPPAPSSNNL